MSGQCEHKNLKLTPELEQFIDECNAKEYSKSNLLAVLHKIQDQFGYLPQELMEEVAVRMSIPTSKIYGVATFYHMFTLEPEGKHSINICLGTACYVKGAEQVLNAFRNYLKIDMNETTEDGLFTLKSTRCIGTCGLAPVVLVDDEVYSKVTPDDVPVIIAKHRQE